jgi:alkanesulfonate monooxygenase SsuD/methylene tetrahydromethanopterin reductase-like flavin-dependent oxidoreductase (luciferase family)
MKMSLCADPGRSRPDVLALAQRADSAGWHAVYVCDYFMPNDRDGRRVADGPMLECWTVLPALAARTSAAGLGSLAPGNTYRHPVHL